MPTNVQLYEEREVILDGICYLTIKGAPKYDMVIISLVFLEKDETTKIRMGSTSKVHLFL